jgi:hypothetical protein
MFQTNVGGIDRILRIVIGAALLIAYAVLPNASWLLLIGVVPLASGLFSTCPAYRLFGISTCPTKQG